jgi:hypothetical protein
MKLLTLKRVPRNVIGKIDKMNPFPSYNRINIMVLEEVMVLKIQELK